MVDAAVGALAGTGQPCLHISGDWVYGNNTAITEESGFSAPAMVTWKEPIEQRVLGAQGAGNLIMLGTGQQHWSTVHVADLAASFRRVPGNDPARGRYVIGDGSNSAVAELTEAAAVAAGAAGAVPGSGPPGTHRGVPRRQLP